MDQNEDHNTDQGRGSLSSEFGGGEASKASASAVLFKDGELDIYVNRVTLDAYIFHGKPLGDIVDHIDYDWDDHSVMVHKKDGTKIDLGVKIQWLIRPYFKKISEIGIIQTKNGETVEGFMVPVNHLNKPAEASEGA